jgi:hypothetical protein
MEILEKNKENILIELYEWVETFEQQSNNYQYNIFYNDFDDDGEEITDSYDTIFALIKRFENGECDENDYNDILFHIEQINYNEIKINLK